MSDLMAANGFDTLLDCAFEVEWGNAWPTEPGDYWYYGSIGETMPVKVWRARAIRDSSGAFHVYVIRSPTWEVAFTATRCDGMWARRNEPMPEPPK